MSTTHYLSADPGRRFIKDFTTDPADACIGGIAGHDVNVDPRYVRCVCVCDGEGVVTARVHGLTGGSGAGTT